MFRSDIGLTPEITFNLKIKTEIAPHLSSAGLRETTLPPGDWRVSPLPAPGQGGLCDAPLGWAASEPGQTPPGLQAVPLQQPRQGPRQDRAGALAGEQVEGNDGDHQEVT